MPPFFLIYQEIDFCDMRIPLEEISTEYFESLDVVGQAFSWRGQFYRGIYPEYKEHVLSILNNPCTKELISEGLIQETEITDYELDGFSLVLSHEKLDFIVYPHEWSDLMVNQIAKFVLKISKRLLKNDLWIYDLQAKNFSFRGSLPVLLDISSIGSFDSRSATVTNYIFMFYAQLLNRVILGSRGNGYVGRAIAYYGESIESEKIIFRWGDRLKLKILRYLKKKYLKRGDKIVESLPAGISKHLKNLRVSTSSKKLTQFMLEALSLRLSIIKKKIPKTSVASYYDFRRQDKKYFELKEKYIFDFLNLKPPLRVLDVACNMGYFSGLACKLGHRVMAFDINSPCVDKMYLEFFNAGNTKINVAICDFYKLSEYTIRNFSKFKSAGMRWKSEVVLFLAYSHHVLLPGGFTYESLFQYLSLLTSSYLVYEYVPLPTNTLNLEKYTDDDFHRSMLKDFSLEACYELDLGRKLYFLRKIESPSSKLLR